MKKFQVTWELHNKHLFENLVFSEPLLQSNLPALVSQIRYLVFVCVCLHGVTAQSFSLCCSGCVLEHHCGVDVLAQGTVPLGRKLRIPGVLN